MTSSVKLRTMVKVLHFVNLNFVDPLTLLFIEGISSLFKMTIHIYQLKIKGK